MGAPRFVLDRFWPSNLFLGGIPGAWYDPTDLSTMFQDSAGTTPVTAVEQPVGRILDKSGNGNHASQSTAASRPTYRARYNLLTYSEDFGNAAWIPFQATVATNATTAPDGTLTADKLQENNTVNPHSTYQLITTGSQSYTLTFYAKAAERSWVKMRGFAFDTYFDVANGTVGSVNPNATASIAPAGNGWYRCSVTGATAASNVQIAITTGNGVDSYQGVAGNGVFIWGAQLLTAADVTATGNAYQRIAAATVYDTAPVFRPYLAFDGVDDSLATAAINFTATDKMTVFAGLTKSSGAALGMVTELGNRNIVQAGSFSLTAPRNAGAPDYSFIVEGTAVTDNTIVTYIAPITNVMTARGDIAASLNQLRVNGAVAGTLTTTLGTGNFGNWALNIGRRNNTNLPFNGRIYELIVRGAASSTTEIIDTETWVNARTGAF